MTDQQRITELELKVIGIDVEMTQRNVKHYTATQKLMQERADIYKELKEITQAGKLKDFEEVKEKWLEDPEVKEAYDELVNQPKS